MAGGNKSSLRPIDKESTKAEMLVVGTNWSKYTEVTSGRRSANALRKHYGNNKLFYAATMQAFNDANPFSRAHGRGGLLRQFTSNRA